MAESQKLQDNLFLNRYYCSMFENKGKLFESLEDFRNLIYHKEEYFDFNFFTKYIRDERLRDKISKYNENIQEYLDKINSKRESEIQLKYFQYLAILFTEIHLDKYFEDSEEMLREINDFLYDLNKLDVLKNDVTFSDEDLRKIAIWSATGSGKTLLMHINYLQIVKYLKDNQKDKQIENFFLITPNEGMTEQHKKELEMSSINSEKLNSSSLSSGSLSKWSGNFTTIKILDNHKIVNNDSDKNKKAKDTGKTVDVNALGKKNIVFVDEGHKGNKSIGSVWKENRTELVKDYGFMFEYSATFAESINKKNDEGFTEYSKSIMFDYRYKYFHKDGYGKDYSILNLSGKVEEENNLEEYLTGALLSFYEQKLIFSRDSTINKNFNIENPLMIFVGSKVAGDNSDIKKAIEFITNFVNKEEKFINYIQKILEGKSDLIDEKTKIQIFENKLNFLKGKSSKEIYSEIIRKIFYAGDNRKLEIKELTAEGELGLRFKDHWFGVINVGDVKSLLKEIEKIPKEYISIEKSIHGSLFDEVEKESSTINFIFGSKKFIEGWNCFRVSSMGIMNMGKTEGAQIIQLFGRGVRLRGYDGTLKRSGEISGIPYKIPEGINEVETLKIFGLSAKYMEIFKSVLDKEGANKKDIIKKLRIKNNFPKEEKLYVPIINKKPAEFFDDVKQILVKNSEKKLELNLKYGVGVIESQTIGGIAHKNDDSSEINQEVISLLDYQNIFLKIKEFCSRKKISNISFSFEEIKSLIKDNSYRILGNSELGKISSEKEIVYLEKIEKYIIKLLEDYLIQEVEKERKEWEKNNFSYGEINEKDDKFIHNLEYTLEIDSELGKNIIDNFEDIVEKVADWDLKENEELNLDILQFLFLEKHLFYPLIYLLDEGNNKEVVTVIPTPLVDSEMKFLDQFKKYLETNKENLPFEKLYLLRNFPKTGTGFSLTNGRYYPDFILWGINGENQSISFIDPKGISQMDKEDEKITLFKEIKKIENKLNGSIKNKIIKLNSFIVTGTSEENLEIKFGENFREKMQENNLFLLEDDFVGEILKRMI